MSLPATENIKIFVYVVESPSAKDLYHGVSEGDLLKQAIKLDNIPCVTRYAVDRETFFAALILGIQEEMKHFPDLLPIIHFSAHGNTEGIQLTNKEIIEWGELRTVLAPINKALQGCLIICMSSCEGYSGIRMALFTEDTELPYFALIGNASSPQWSDTAVAYATFYHLIAKGEHVTDAVEAMRIASGNKEFFFDTAENSRSGYLEYHKNKDSVDAKTLLRDGIEKAPPSNLEKLKELERK